MLSEYTHIDSELYRVPTPPGMQPERAKSIWEMARQDAQDYINSVSVNNWMTAKSGVNFSTKPDEETVFLYAKKAVDSGRLKITEAEEYKNSFRVACEQGTYRDN